MTEVSLDSLAMTAAPDSRLATLWCPAPNREARCNGRKPDMLILHYTGMESAEGALDWLTRQESGVSCHYLIDEEGQPTRAARDEILDFFRMRLSG